MIQFVKTTKNQQSVIQRLPIPMAYLYKTKLRDYNPAFQAIFPKSINQSLPIKTLFDLNTTQTSCHSELKKQLLTKQIIHFECATRDNYWYHIQISPDPDNAHGHYVSAYDISQFKRRDELLSVSNKMEALGQLAGGVAHDFNNILSIIEGYAALIVKSPVHDHDNIITHAQRILQASKRGAGITRQLLTFGRHKIIGDSVVTLAPFFEELKNLLYPLLDVDISLDITIDKECEAIKASNEQLSQIIFNSITNARDAIGENRGHIGIHVARAKKGYIAITIHDDGMGMDDDIKKRALEPFFTTKPAGKGTGLGLSQIYGLMEQLGGSLEIFSQKDKGTSLVLTFQEGTHIDIELPSYDDVRASLNGHTILLVDDESDILFVLKNILEDQGFHILTAKSGNEALALQEDYDYPIHWLVSDVVMEDMNGPKLGQLFEATRPETKIIYMSGYPASGDMARVQLPKDAIYLAKPIDPYKLMALMASMNGQHDQNQSYLSAQLSMLAGQWNDNSKKGAL